MTHLRSGFAIYSRKSKFTGKGESIENQIELCRQHIRLGFGAQAAAEAAVFEDEGFSGGNLERPQFKEMMEAARKGAFQYIVVYRLDRISRNIGDFAGLIGEMNELGIHFISIKEQFDTASPLGRAMMYIASVFSQLERETIAERIRDNMQELAKTGRWLGGNTPTGYTSEQVERMTLAGKVHRACKLKLVEDEAAVVKLIYQQFLTTKSLTKTDAFLLQQGFVTKNHKRFSRFAIKAILSNPVYMKADQDAWAYLCRQETELCSGRELFDGTRGMMVYNRTLQQKGKASQVRPMTEWIAAVGDHPGLVDGADWIRAQELLERNRDRGYRKPRSNVALLSGLLYCGSCHSYMRPKLTARVNADGEQLYPYVCELKERSRGQCCQLRNVTGNLLDRLVLEEMTQLPRDEGQFRLLLEQGKQALLANHKDCEGQVERLRRSLAEKEVEISGLVTALGKAAGTPAEEYVLRQIEALHAVIAGYRKQIEDSRAAVGAPPLAGLEAALLREMRASFATALDTMGVEEKRAALRSCIYRVVWDGETAQVYFFGAGDTGNASGTETVCGPLCEDSK